MIGRALRGLFRPRAEVPRPCPPASCPPASCPPASCPPASCPLEIVPVNDMAALDGVFHSTGNDPYCLLQPPPGHGFPSGRCEFAFRADPGVMPLLPVLYLDTGAGFNEAQTVRLAGGAEGQYRQILYLPPDLQRLRFDPAVMAGPLPLHGAQIIPRPGPSLPATRTYADWILCYDSLQPEDVADIAARIAAMPARPQIQIRLAGEDPALRARTQASLQEQLYREWWLAGPDDPVAAPALLMQAGDWLAPHALYCLVTAAPDATMLLMDEDRRDPVTQHRSAPLLRGAPSAENLAGGSPGAALVRDASLIPARQAGPDAIAALALHALQSGPAGTVAHVPGILLHRADAAAAAMPARPSPPATLPPVSVIIPSKDSATLLRRTLDGVLHRTDYPALDVLVMDNGSTQPDALAVLAAFAADPRVRVIPVPGPFNYAAANNAGVAAATGEIVLLLNNDMDVIHPDWLTILVGQALRPEVGAVGAKLLYADGTIQHAGIVTGMTGLAGHPWRGLPADAPGPHGALQRMREVSAVTGACLAVRRALYQQVGGLDATSLAVSYNDVDFCLRLRAAGHRIIWTPFAMLYHLESASRGLDSRPDNAARAQSEHDALLRRWGAALLRDPFHNENLSVADEGCGLAWPPRGGRPWRNG